MTYNPISQNDDDYFYTAVCAYLRGEANGVVPGTVGEEQAEIAGRLIQDNPAILDDEDRLLAEIATIHYRESGIEAAGAYWVEREKEYHDDLFANLVAYVRGQPHTISPATNHETWAEQAKQLAAEDPTILDDKKRLLAATCYRSPPTEADLLERPKGWLVHNGRVNRDCISKAEYDRRMEERRAAGLLIDPSTAEIYREYVNFSDVYGDGLPLLPQQDLLLDRVYFARAPASDIWVFFGDLPDATRDAIWKRFENEGEQEMIEATIEELFGEAAEPAITDEERKEWEATWAKRKQEYRQQQANHWARRTQIEAQMESEYRAKLSAALQHAMDENRNPKVAEALDYVSMMLEAHWKNDPCHRFDDEQDRVSIFPVPWAQEW